MEFSMRFPVVFATALVALGLSASSANACNLNGAFIVAFQSNDTIVTFDGIAQIGEEIAGNAAFRDVRGHFRGIMKRNGILSFVTEWNDGTQGAYTAQVTDDGRLSEWTDLRGRQPRQLGFMGSWRQRQPAAL
jgi:hypothetical protein